jgi:hypothetical protein
MASLTRALGGKQFISAAVRGGVKMVKVFILNSSPVLKYCLLF